MWGSSEGLITYLQRRSIGIVPSTISVKYLEGISAEWKRITKHIARKTVETVLIIYYIRVDTAIYAGRQCWPQSTQSAGPVRFLIFCSISIFLLSSLVAGKGPQCSAGHCGRECTPPYLSTGISKSAPASPGRSRAGPSLYIFSLLVVDKRAVPERSKQD
jgi:hypothetical protein